MEPQGRNDVEQPQAKLLGNEEAKFLGIAAGMETQGPPTYYMPSEYGTIYQEQPVPMFKPPRTTRDAGLAQLNLMTLIGCVFGPTLLFIVTCYVRAMELHYISNTCSLIICFFILAVIFVGGCSPSWNFESSKSRLWTFLLLTGICAWVAGVIFGEHNYQRYFKPYWDINNLNSYDSVDLANYTGQTLMDAGQVQFAAGTTLNLALSYGFKNEEIYCVAPIVPSGTNKTLKNYDFWAIGTNCCSGHKADFKCGEYNNPAAQSGLRLMQDDERGFFKLAVEEATAAYNIQSTHPVFLYWMESPAEEIKAYQHDGCNSFVGGVIFFMFVQCCLTYLAVSLFV